MSRLLRFVRAEFVFLTAVAVGLYFRLDQIADQIVGDDEWHALMVVKREGYGYILSHFGWADYSIPLTLYYKALCDTIGLSELGMRAPMLLCGISALVCLPLLFRRYVGQPVADSFAWLLAISPLHVYFSRYARPYSVSLLFAMLGVLAILEWWKRPRLRLAVAYLACALLGIYFHLIVAPFLLAPFAFFALQRFFWGRVQGQASLSGLAALGGIVAFGLALLLAVPMVVDWASVAIKAGMDEIDVASFGPSLELLGGASNDALRGLIGLGLVAGTVAAIERRSFLVGYLLFLNACLLIALSISKPGGVLIPIVFVRYALPLLPLLLLLLAMGFTQVDAWIQFRWNRWPRGVAAVGAPLLLLGFGPLWEVHYRPNNWTNHAWFQYQYSREARRAYEEASLVPARMPAFYGGLASSERGSFGIVEAPWDYQWQCCEFPVFQRIHRQRMFIGFVSKSLERVPENELPRSNAAFRFENFVHVSDFAGLDRRDVKYVVFHRNLRKELRSPITMAPLDVGPWIQRYTNHFGAPVFEDEDITVFDIRTKRH